MKSQWQVSLLDIKFKNECKHLDITTHHGFVVQSVDLRWILETLFY